MKTTQTFFSALFVSALAACANVPFLQKKTETPPSPPPVATSASCQPGSKGCPTAETPAVKSAWQKGKETALAEVTAYVQKAKSSDQPLSMTSAFAYRKDPLTGKIERAEAVKNVVLRPLATDRISRSDKVWADIVREFARQAALANANEPMQLVISTTSATRGKVSTLVNEGVAQAKTSQKLGIEYVDAREAKNALMFFQAFDQKQFNQ